MEVDQDQDVSVNVKPGRGRGRRSRGRGRAAGRSKAKDYNEPEKDDVKENIDHHEPQKPAELNLEDHILDFEAPTFTTIKRGPPEPMLRLSWTHRVNLIGDKVVNPMIHCCELCSKPIITYGRMIPCKHVFCLRCGRDTHGTCPRCGDKVDRVEEAGVGQIFMCTYEGTRNSTEGCRRTYLSQRDLQAHIYHRHAAIEVGNQAPSSRYNSPKRVIEDHHPRPAGEPSAQDPRRHSDANAGVRSVRHYPQSNYTAPTHHQATPPSHHQAAPPNLHQATPPSHHQPPPPNHHQTAPPSHHQPAPNSLHQPTPPNLHQPAPPNLHQPAPPSHHQPVPPGHHQPAPPAHLQPTPPPPLHHQPTPVTHHQPTPVTLHQATPPGLQQPGHHQPTVSHLPPAPGHHQPNISHHMGTAPNTPEQYTSPSPIPVMATRTSNLITIPIQDTADTPPPPPAAPPTGYPAPPPAQVPYPVYQAPPPAYPPTTHYGYQYNEPSQGGYPPPPGPPPPPHWGAPNPQMPPRPPGPNQYYS